jgi:acyl-CoA dehydrogenase
LSSFDKRIRAAIASGSWRDEFGNESHWSRELGRAVMAAGADALWATITTG